MSDSVDLILQPYDWSLENNNNLRIISWCLDQEGRTYCIRIINFYYSFYVEADKKVRSIIDNLMKKHHGSIIMAKGEGKTLYYYQKSKRLFYHIGIMSKAILNEVLSKLKGSQIQVYEKDIDPILKFITKRNLRYSKHILFKKLRAPRERISKADFEYFTEYDNCHPTGDEISWVAYPKILSFDIECYSEERNTMPKPFFSANKILMISAVVQRYFDKDSEKEKYIITHVPFDESKIDAQVIQVDDEEELLDKFQDLICELRPQIITGFNIYGFDFSYITARLGVYLKTWKNIGLLKEEFPEIKEVSWESSAYGQQKMIYPRASGIITIDLMRFVSREYKLPTYSLNTVSDTFLGRKKHDVSHEFIFESYDAFLNKREDYEKSRERFNQVILYCIEDANLVLDIFKVLNLWITLVEMSNIFYVAITDLYTRGQQIRCFNQLYKKSKEKELFVIEKKKDEFKSYEGADVIEPRQGIHDYVICLDFKSLYPSIIIQKNICYTTFIENPSEEIKKDCNVISWDKYTYYFYRKQKGLIPSILEELIQRRNEIRNNLMKNKKGIEYVVLDKKQLALKISSNAFFGFLGTKDKGMLPLTPASMCITAVGRDNIRKCKKIIEEEYKANVIYGDTDSVFFNIPGVNSIEQTFEMGKKIKDRINSIFERPLEIEFEKACKMLCLLKKNYSFWYYDQETKDYKYNIHINCEESLKKRVESILPKIMGQLKIGENKIFIDPTFPSTSSDSSINSSINLSINSPVNPSTNLRCVIIRKEPALENKGNALSRRDKFRFMKKLYERVLKAILVERQDMDNVYNIIQESILSLVTLNYNIDDLYTIKSVHTNYSNHSMYKTIVEKMKSEEKAVYEGLKIEIIILKSTEKKKIGESAFIREEAEKLSDLKKQVNIDYYIKLLVTPIEEGLYQIAMKDIIESKKSARYVGLLNRLKKRFPYIESARKVLEDNLSKKLSDIDWLRYLRTFSENPEIIEEIDEFDKDFRVSPDKPVTNLIKLIEIRRELLNELSNKFCKLSATSKTKTNSKSRRKKNLFS
jgi:DNA polymerase elongation subunit (family B)